MCKGLEEDELSIVKEEPAEEEEDQEEDVEEEDPLALLDLPGPSGQQVGFHKVVYLQLIKSICIGFSLYMGIPLGPNISMWRYFL